MLRRAGTVAALLVLLPSVAVAQRGIVTQGARELLLPNGARAIGMGQAVVGDEMGSEGIWWNPASVAWRLRPEGGLHHVQAAAYTSELVSVVYPALPIGTFAGGLNYVNLGCFDETDGETGEVIGTDCNYALTVVAGFATTFGRNLAAGVNYKLFRAKYGLDTDASTTALDFGAQYRVPAVPGLSVGAAIRHLGLRLQVKDEAQADALPTMWELGASYRMALTALDSAAHAKLAFSLVDRAQSAGPGFRVGGEAGWRNTYHARAGYVIYSHMGSAPSLGLGATTGRLTIDIARVFGDNSSALGEPPTYLSLRISF